MAGAVVNRQLKVKARRLKPNYILALRESFAHSNAKGAHITWTHGFGFGITQLAIEVKFADGEHYTETLALAPLMQKWASEILKEHEAAPRYTLCAGQLENGDPCPFFIDENPAYKDTTPEFPLAEFTHLHRGDDEDEAKDDHEPVPGEVHTLDWWQAYGPARVKERFV